MRACACCHEPAADAITCLGCRVVLHPECLAPSGRCPTGRCQGPLLPRPALLTARVREEAFSALAWVVLAAAAAFLLRERVWVWLAVVVAIFGCGGLLSALSDWSDLSTPRKVLDEVGRVEGDPVRGLAAAREDVLQRPRRPVPRLRLALALEELSRADEAEPHLEWLLRTQTTRDVQGNDVPRAVTVRCLAHLIRDDALAALRELVVRGVARDPGAATWWLRVQALRRLGDLEGAMRDADEGVRHAGEEDPLPLEARARVWLALGRPDAALADVEAGLERSPWRWLYLLQGVARAQSGYRASALESLALAEPGAREAALWRLALGAPATEPHRLQGFDVEVARALRGELSEAALLDQAGAAAGGPRSRARRLRRAHGFLAVAADARGETAAADAHAGALLALGPDGSLEHDWALARGRAPAEAGT